MNTETKLKDVIAHFQAEANSHSESASKSTDSDMKAAHEGHAKVYGAMTSLLETFDEFAFGGFGGSDAIDIKKCICQMEKLKESLSNY